MEKKFVESHGKNGRRLSLTAENIGNYFCSLDTTLSDGVRDPFIDNVYDNARLKTVVENDLNGIRNDCGLKLEYTKLVQDID